MKIKITLLILLITCAKLTASAVPVDTNKVRQTVTQNDTVKQNYNLKYLTLADFSISKHSSNNIGVGAIPHYNDDYNAAVPVNRQPDYSLTAITYPDSLNITKLVHSSGSLSMADSHLAENVNNKIRIKNADSLRLLAIMLRQDSIRISIYKQNKDSVRRQLVSMNLDSLKLLLKYPASDLYKGQIYTEIANRYLDYDTVSNKTTRASYQNKALSYTMLALHQFSSFNDTTGLRVTFDHLTKVYMAQKKFSQAKWFILQSNSLSRAKNDAINVIASLITLAKIKTEVGDSKLAMGDLDEALQISTTKKNLKLQSEVLRNYAMLYSRLKNYPKEEALLKRRDSIEDIIRKNEEAKQLAALTAEKKKADSAQAKKKVFTSNTKKPSKNGSGSKVATL